MNDAKIPRTVRGEVWDAAMSGLLQAIGVPKWLTVMATSVTVVDGQCLAFTVRDLDQRGPQGQPTEWHCVIDIVRPASVVTSAGCVVAP
jgi:hypothetical protein